MSFARRFFATVVLVLFLAASQARAETPPWLRTCLVFVAGAAVSAVALLGPNGLDAYRAHTQTQHAQRVRDGREWLTRLRTDDAYRRQVIGAQLQSVRQLIADARWHQDTSELRRWNDRLEEEMGNDRLGTIYAYLRDSEAGFSSPPTPADLRSIATWERQRRELESYFFAHYLGGAGPAEAILFDR